MFLTCCIERITNCGERREFQKPKILKLLCHCKHEVLICTAETTFKLFLVIPIKRYL